MTNPDIVADAYYEGQAEALSRTPASGPAPKPGIVDTDYVGNTDLPTFDWAGTTIGNQMTMECSQCGSLVRADNTDKHATMHGILNGVANYNGIQL